MSTTTSAAPVGTGLDLWGGNSGVATSSSGESFYKLLASIYTAAASFGIQFLIFLLLRIRLSRIYRPKSYLVAERERIAIPPSGLYKWIVPIFTTPDSTIIQKCGLDAYFFLRYLRMLLKIFTPLALLIIPILLPINQRSGDGSVKGVDVLGWQNVSDAHSRRRWAHLVLSIVAVVWILYVVYKELRVYIRIRQAYLTSPQHRLRASATTVLVSGIPKKWLTVDALNGLYDVFPGGIRNIWINRNFDELAEKVEERDDIAHALESAETALIRNCVQKHKKAEAKKAKLEGRAKRTKQEKEQDRDEANQEAENIAQGAGVSSGDPHNIPHNIHEALQEIDDEEQKHHRDHSPQGFLKDPFLKIGKGFGAFGHAIGHKGKQFVGEVTGDVDKAFRTVDKTVNSANTGPGFGAGFVLDDDEVYQARAPPKARPETQAPPYSSNVSYPSDVKKPTGLRQSEDVAVMQRIPPPQASPLAQSEVATSPGSTQSGDRDHLQPQSPESPLRASMNEKTASPTPPRRGWNHLPKYRRDPPLDFPSPQPHTAEEDEFPLRDVGRPTGNDLSENPDQAVSKSKSSGKFAWIFFWRKKEDDEADKVEYPTAFNEEYAEDQAEGAVWQKYMDAKDRDTIRAPLFDKSWFPRLPLVGKKMDKIYYLRKELARLNVEIELDQQDVERFPFMNSAFIQFNHQVAAHMACQSLSHHVPHHMTPRIVEIAPTDVIWENMSMKWSERYVRTALGFAISIGLVVLYVIPVAFSGVLSELDDLANAFTWLQWLHGLPKQVKAIIEGVLPPVLLSVILALVPVIFRFLVKQRGVPTGSARERGVQFYYFTFLFIQVFLVVTLSSRVTSIFQSIVDNPSEIAKELASNLPKASNYFFSYLTVQALSNSASAILQVGSLLVWFLWAPLVDSTAREKWRRQTKLKEVRWGSFFPPFTNFAVIGIIFSTIAPLIMVFNLVVFSVYWLTQKYNVLYVYQFRIDTGGLLFPTAVNQLFVGVYVLEVCLIGLFFLADSTSASGTPQAIVMIVVLVFTVIYQWLLNDAFRPLFQYLPITLEDDAVIRDEEFARAQHQHFQRLTAEEDGNDGDLQDVLDRQDRDSAEEERLAVEAERKRIQEHKRNMRVFSSHSSGLDNSGIMATKPAQSSGEDRWRQVKNFSQPVHQLRNVGRHVGKLHHSHSDSSLRAKHGQHGIPMESMSGRGRKPTAVGVDPQKMRVDVESQKAVGDVLYSGFSDELEDLTPEERDTLIRYSFQHSALRARRPVVWIPRDPLGISDDEIERCKRMSTVESVDAETEKRDVKTNIWISNEGTALDAKGRVVFRRSPPDFANVDLIAL